MSKEKHVDDVITRVRNGVFESWGGYGDDGYTEQLYCKICGSSEFAVGQGRYYTMIKCVKCDYEVCINEG